MFLNFASKHVDPRCWPLNLRLALFFTLAMTLTLSAVSGLMYHELVRNIYQKDCEALKRSIKIQQAIIEKLERQKWPDVWQQEWREHIDRADRLAIRVIAPNGDIYSVSHNMVAPRDAFPAPSESVNFQRWRNQKEGSENDFFLLTAIPVSTKNGTQWIIEGALDITRNHQLIEEYRTTLFLFSIIAIFISSVASWLLAKHGLAPVREISGEISRINAEKLNVRIGNKRWPSDLQQLTHTVDTMLGRLEDSFEQLTRFSSDIAHEFRSPINNLVAAASVTLAHDRDINEYKETLAVIVEEGERLSRMVSSMLFLARADNAQQALHIEQLSVKTEFEKVADFFEALAEESQVKLTTVGDCNINADPLLLRRTLSNLITNALQHTPAGGEIRVTAEQHINNVIVSVSDTGSGISTEHLPYIFDRFYRIDAARSASESTGLGLAVVKSILEMHGGSIQVTSKVGAGSIFTLNFP